MAGGKARAFTTDKAEGAHRMGRMVLQRWQESCPRQGGGDEAGMHVYLQGMEPCLHSNETRSVPGRERLPSSVLSLLERGLSLCPWAAAGPRRQVTAWSARPGRGGAQQLSPSVEAPSDNRKQLQPAPGLCCCLSPSTPAAAPAEQTVL